MSNFRIYCLSDSGKNKLHNMNESEHCLNKLPQINDSIVLTREFIYNNYKCRGVISSEEITIFTILKSDGFKRFIDYFPFIIIYSEQDSSLYIVLPLVYKGYNNQLVYNNCDRVSSNYRIYQLSLDMRDVDSSETIKLVSSDLNLYTIFFAFFDKKYPMLDDKTYLNYHIEEGINFGINDLVYFTSYLTFSSEKDIYSLYNYYKNNPEVFTQFVKNSRYCTEIFYNNIIFDYTLNKAFLILEDRLQELDYSPPVNVTAQVIIKNDPHPEILKYELNDKVVYFKHNQIFAY